MKLFRLLAAGLVPFLNLGGFIPLLATSTGTDPAVLAAADSLVVAGGKFWSKAYTTGKVFDGTGWVYADGTSGGTVDPSVCTGYPTPPPSGNNGWDGSTYYLNGTASSLDSTGSGFNTSDETYYINGLATTLDKDGNGFGPGGNLYTGGQDTGGATGWDPTSNSYYIDGAWTPLDQTGKGWNNDEGVYYVAGQQKWWLDSNGTGADWDSNTYYINGEVVDGLNGDGNGFGPGGNIWTFGYDTGSNSGYNWADNIFYSEGRAKAVGGYLGAMYDLNGNYIGGGGYLDQNGNGYAAGVTSGGNWIPWYNFLPSDYIGTNGGIQYVGGKPFSDPTGGVQDGWSGYGYYLNGQVTTLDQNGNGGFGSVYYQNGKKVSSNIGSYDFYDANGVYLGYAPMDWGMIDTSGNGWGWDPYGEAVQWAFGLPVTYSGNINGVQYINGQIDPYYTPGMTGWSGMGYYINGAGTTLNQDGSGVTREANGDISYYTKGVRLAWRAGGNPDTFDGNGAFLGLAGYVDKYGNGTGAVWSEENGGEFVWGVTWINGLPATYNGVVNGVQIINGVPQQ